MTKHTPGPWAAGQPVGGFSGTTIQTATETIAHHVDDKNAALIAAAPDLLELLKQMPDFDKCWCPELDVKRAAIEDGFCPGCQARAKVAEIAGENQ